MVIHEDRTSPSSYVVSSKPVGDTIHLVALRRVKAYSASPTSETVSAVTAWLQESNKLLSNISVTGAIDDWGSFSTDLSLANELLDADFEIFTHIETGNTITRTLAYSLPQDLLQYLVAAGQPVLGFLNPFLYANPTALFDITKGIILAVIPMVSRQRGPVTGLGIPNFPVLLAAAGI
ncbi:hypothetical protein BT96DRAFT_932213 [Gymnopus androsaceus JB14]|uniref:Peptidase S53 activation domain-containing protein n=1 Tax=Gymnopus androsaceus JB14 TaxID=1447944 RepID=A0A6A4I9U9_9AGAR|nr:hypothetical protein BT96DRAFT_932213 [Gymnopus androsaceus JB14]